MRTMCRGSPADWVSLSALAQDVNSVYGAVMHSVKECWESAQTVGVDVTGRLLETGLFGMMVDGLKAFEASGATRRNRIGNPIHHEIVWAHKEYFPALQMP